MIKLVMGVIMVTVLFSRLLMLPVYMSQLHLIGEMSPATSKLLSNTSFGIMMFALGLGAFIVLKAMWVGKREERLREQRRRAGHRARSEAIHGQTPQDPGLARRLGVRAQRAGPVLRPGARREVLATAATVVPGVDGDLELVGIGDLRAALRRPGEAILAQARALAEAERVPLKTILEEGEAWERITHLADDERCDLIVIGRRGLRRLERVMIGSVTARVIGHTDRDVLVVPQDTALSFKRILVATDGSAASSAGAEHAINVAASYGGELLALSVVDLPDEAFADAPKVAEQLLAKAAVVRRRDQGEGRRGGRPLRRRHAQGRVFEVVTRIAREREAGLIVTGSHGRTGLRRLLVGSVAEKVIGYAPCPVLVVKG